LLRVKVLGRDRTIAKFVAYNAEVEASINATMIRAAQPMAREAAGVASRWGPGVAQGMAALTVGPRTVAVRQQNRATTGQRPDFGSLQMREAILPSVERHKEHLKQKLEAALHLAAREF